MKNLNKLIANLKVFLIFISPFSLIVLPISYLIYEDSKKYDEINNNRGVTVGQFSFIGKYGKSKPKFIKYYVGNKFYRTEIGVCTGIDSAELKNYYIVYYSKLNPEYIEVDFTKKVIDTIKIMESGFSKNEILGRPRTYDWDWPQ